MKILETIVRLILWSLVVFLLFFILFPIKTVADYEPPHAFDKLDLWLNKLAHCESRGIETAINEDDGGSDSLGLLQFKVQTFEYYSLKYGVTHETTNAIMSGEAQKRLARAMLEAEPEAWRHWYNCTKKIGYPPTYTSD